MLPELPAGQLRALVQWLCLVHAPALRQVCLRADARLLRTRVPVLQGRDNLDDQSNKHNDFTNNNNHYDGEADDHVNDDNDGEADNHVDDDNDGEADNHVDDDELARVHHR